MFLQKFANQVLRAPYLGFGVRSYKTIRSTGDYGLLNPLRLTHPRDFIPRRGSQKRKKKFEDRPLLLGKKNLFEVYEPVAIEETYKDGFTAEELEGADELVKKALRMNNASTEEIFKYRLAQAVKKFQQFPNDTGSSAVQVATMTERIIHIANHLARNRQDKVAKRHLQTLLDRRRKLMAYLRRTNYHYFKWVVKEYNIPEIVPHHSHHSQNFHLGYYKIAQNT